MIEAKAVIDNLEKHKKKALENGLDAVLVSSQVVDIIVSLLEKQEPKVSEWLEDSDPGQEYGTTWACRKCMHSVHKPYIWNPYGSGYKYCPNCGAKMEAANETD